MTLMDKLVAGHTADLIEHLADAASLPDSDLEGRRESQSPPPGAVLGAPPALLPAEAAVTDGLSAERYT